MVQKMTAPIPNIEFHDGHSIPQVGLGVFEVEPSEAQAVIEKAIEIGYRAIDTASAYGNEEGVGRAVAASGLPREQLFITSKLANEDQGYDSALKAFDASMERLGLDRLDLYLIHWPAPIRDLYVETWRALERLKEEGRVSSIGVSNFRVEDLERLGRECEQVPVLNQIELHPMLPQEELRKYHEERGIVTEAWSPLAKATILAHPILVDVAKQTGRTPSQVVLRWHLQLGNVVIPKTVTEKRMSENLGVFDFTLSPDHMAEIAKLDNGTRLGSDPNTFPD